MKLEEAIKILNWSQQQMRLGNLPDYSQNVYQAEIVVLQELEHLQKENEELISEKTKLLLTDLSEANKLYDEENKRCMMFAIENNDLKEKLDNSISKDKIREKKDYYYDRAFSNSYIKPIKKTQALAMWYALNDLLKEE